MVVDIKSVLICDAVDSSCVALLEANGIKVRIILIKGYMSLFMCGLNEVFNFKNFN